MEKTSSFFQRKFLLYAFILVSLGIAATFSSQVGVHIRNVLTMRESTNAPALSVDLDSTNGFKIWSALFFAVGIYAIRNINFTYIFRGGLLVSALLLTLTACFFDKSLFSCYIIVIVCSNILTFLGWTYVNQMVTQSEGKKYYFALNCIAFIAILAAANGGLFLMRDAFTSPSYPTKMLAASLVFIGVSLFCERSIHKGPTSPLSEEPTSSGIWTPILSLSILVAGIKIITGFESRFFRSAVNALIKTSPEEGCAAIGIHFIIVGIGTSLLALLSMFVGPLLVRKRGWKGSLLFASGLCALATLPVLFCSSIFAYTANQVLLNGIMYSLIYPLVEICLICLAVKNRFLVRGMVYLVITPLLLQGVPLLNVSLATTHLLDFVVLGLMALCAVVMARKNSALSTKAQ